MIFLWVSFLTRDSCHAKRLIGTSERTEGCAPCLASLPPLSPECTLVGSYQTWKEKVLFLRVLQLSTFKKLQPQEFLFFFIIIFLIQQIFRYLKLQSLDVGKATVRNIWFYCQVQLKIILSVSPFFPSPSKRLENWPRLKCEVTPSLHQCPQFSSLHSPTNPFSRAEGTFGAWILERVEQWERRKTGLEKCLCWKDHSRLPSLKALQLGFLNFFCSSNTKCKSTVANASITHISLQLTLPLDTILYKTVWLPQQSKSTHSRHCKHI